MKRLATYGLCFMLLCSFAAAPLSAQDSGSPPPEKSDIGAQASDGKGDPDPARRYYAHDAKKVLLTAEERAWLRAHPDIALGYTDTFEPEVIAEPDGTYRGILVDFLDELNRRLGTRIGLKIDSVTQIIEKAKTQAIDGICNIHAEYADALGLLKTRGYMLSYPTVFGRKNIDFKGPGDLAGKTVAIIDKVYITEKIVRQYGKRATLMKVKDALEGLKRVDKGEADFFVGGSTNNYLLTKYQFYGLAPKFLFHEDMDKYGMAVRPDWPELVSILNKGISSFSQNEIGAIVAKWVRVPLQRESISLTAEERAWLKAHPKILLGSPIIPPWNFVDEITGQYKGIVPDYLELIGSKLGIAFKNIADDFGKIHQMAREKKIDGISVAGKTAEREAFLNFAEPYFTLQYSIVTRKQSAPVATFADLAHKRTGILENSAGYAYLKKNYPNVELITFKAYDAGMLAVLNGEIDAWVGSLAGVVYAINTKGLFGLKMAVVPFEMSREMRIGVRKDWPELVGIISKAIASIGGVEGHTQGESRFFHRVNREQLSCNQVSSFRYCSCPCFLGQSLFTCSGRSFRPARACLDFDQEY